MPIERREIRTDRGGAAPAQRAGRPRDWESERRRRQPKLEGRRLSTGSQGLGRADRIRQCDLTHRPARGPAARRRDDIAEVFRQSPDQALRDAAKFSRLGGCWRSDHDLIGAQRRRHHHHRHDSSTVRGHLHARRAIILAGPAAPSRSRCRRRMIGRRNGSFPHPALSPGAEKRELSATPHEGVTFVGGERLWSPRASNGSRVLPIRARMLLTSAVQ